MTGEEIKRRDRLHKELVRVAIDRKFIRAGHHPENTRCDHRHYEFRKHGRYCTCGTAMVDFGD